jgi:hypothetical protein
MASGICSACLEFRAMIHGEASSAKVKNAPKAECRITNVLLWSSVDIVDTEYRYQEVQEFAMLNWLKAE